MYDIRYKACNNFFSKKKMMLPKLSKKERKGTFNLCIFLDLQKRERRIEIAKWNQAP